MVEVGGGDKLSDGKQTTTKYKAKPKQNKTQKKNVETKQTNRKPHKLSDDDPAMNSPLCPFLCP